MMPMRLNHRNEKTWFMRKYKFHSSYAVKHPPFTMTVFCLFVCLFFVFCWFFFFFFFVISNFLGKHSTDQLKIVL